MIIKNKWLIVMVYMLIIPFAMTAAPDKENAEQNKTRYSWRKVIVGTVTVAIVVGGMLYYSRLKSEVRGGKIVRRRRDGDSLHGIPASVASQSSVLRMSTLPAIPRGGKIPSVVRAYDSSRGLTSTESSQSHSNLHQSDFFEGRRNGKDNVFNRNWPPHNI